MNFRQYGIFAAALAIWATAASGGMQWGGIVPPGQEHQLRASVGGIFEFEGMVEETTRKYYDAVGRYKSQRDAESYGTSDFDADGFYGMIGFSLNCNWQVFRLQLDTSFMNPQIDATASRNYYLTLQDDISYRGKNYDHLMIPKGSPFTMEMFGNLTELTLSLVPFSFEGAEGTLVINPMLDLGVMAVVGKYEIDAGDSRGVTEYQNPPELFVIGGKGEGLAGAGLPQFGVGVNVLMGDPEGMQLELDAHYLMMTYNGSTGFFTTAEHRKKDLDLDHRNIRLRGALQFPLGDVRMIAGVQLELIDLDGTLESSAKSREEIIARRERFDKEFAFKMHSVVATFGFVF